MSRRRIRHNRVDALRVFAETGIIVNHWVAVDVLVDCIRSGKLFPDALVEHLVALEYDADGKPVVPAQRLTLVRSYHRAGFFSDTQLRSAICDHPILAYVHLEGYCPDTGGGS